jgi:DNA modification methylase
MDYQEFLNNKDLVHIGINANLSTNSVHLFDFQQAIVNWALKKGRAAVFADCGMGKTRMQLTWLDVIQKSENKPVLLISPLGIIDQTIDEAKAIGLGVNNMRDNPFINGINIINYEQLENISPQEFIAVSLDESSILKSLSGKYRTLLIEYFKDTPYRLCNTATPSPNDFMELGNHSEFLGIMSRTEMLAMFFINDAGDTGTWILKGHGKKKFWKWISSWAVMLTDPSDIGFESKGYTLPKLNFIQHIIKTNTEDHFANGYLIPLPAADLSERLMYRRNSVEDRIKYVADLINDDARQWIIWTELNDEADLAKELVKESNNLSGADSDVQKLKKIWSFQNACDLNLITKPKLAAYGFNWQHCHNMVFASLSDSYEQFYQAVRRCYRFGQKNEVNVHLVVTESQLSTFNNIQDKHKKAEEMKKAMIEEFKQSGFNINQTKQEKADYYEKRDTSKSFDIYNADCCEIIKRLPDESLDYSIFSPPFASLYTYSNSDRDMGNCKDSEEFYTHFKFFVDELFKKIKSGRLVSFHCMNLPTSKQNDGFIGIKDFRGDLIRLFQDAGFVYHSEVCIWKDPVIAMQRTKALGLLHKQIQKDSAMCRQGIPDYLVTMRKLGTNPNPVKHTKAEFPVDVWQKYASPVWFDINPSKTLQYTTARDADDERHICPLQLQVIERAIDLWTNQGDLVFSPFMGIGSEGYVAVQKGRRFVGTELKPSYYKIALQNMHEVEKFQQQDMFMVAAGE